MDESTDPVSGMAFPHAVRLELDELLEQLVARADDLDKVLRHIVDRQ
jgi:hypothetical protein